MPIEAITCAIPLCATEENETPLSKGVRITFLAFGIITLLAGTLALFRVSGFQTLGQAGGATLIALGAVAVLLPALLRQVYRITKSIDTSFAKKPGVYLEHFVASQEPEDLAVKERLKKELKIDDLDARLAENGIKHETILYMIPLGFNDKAEFVEDETVEALKLVYMTDQEILALPLAEVSRFEERRHDILIERLTHIPLPSSSQDDTLGALLLYNEEEIGSKELDPSLYLYFSSVQLLFFIKHHGLDVSIVNRLLPSFESEEHLSSINSHTEKKLGQLPTPTFNQLLPFMKGPLLFVAVTKRKNDVNSALIDEAQLIDLFSGKGLRDASSFERNYKKIPVALLNRFLDHLGEVRLKKIAESFLAELDLANAPQPVITILFHEKEQFWKSLTERKLGKLSIQTINAILTKLGEDLACIPIQHLADPLLDLSPLSVKELKMMFPTTNPFRLDHLHLSEKQRVTPLLKK